VTAPVLLVDYGMVISESQPPQSLRAMAALAGLELPEFVKGYWEHRPAYDRGTSARAYWSAVIGRPLGGDPLLEQLTRLDLASWSHLNRDTLRVLGAAHERGSTMSLLSNAPHDLAAMLSEHPALADFDHLIFSSRLGVVKPERAVFDAAVDLIQRRPAEVVLIDDRQANVEGAIKAGLQAVLFTSAEQLRSELLDRGAYGQPRPQARSTR
jgi:putative hydrolase of the HAD superfamily